MKHSVATMGCSRAHDRRKAVAPVVTAKDFLSTAACAALTGLLANPVAHEEQIRWDYLTREAWDIAAEMVKSAPDGALANDGQ